MGFDTKRIRRESRFSLKGYSKKEVPKKRNRPYSPFGTKTKVISDTESVIRRTRLKKLGFASYREYLRSSLWKKNKERLKRRIPKDRCQRCKKKTTYLQPHHRTYKNIGSEKVGDVIWICGECHRQEHFKYRRKRKPC